MITVHTLEKVNLPEEVKTLLERLVLHAFTDCDHLVKLVDVEQVARLHGRC